MPYHHWVAFINRMNQTNVIDVIWMKSNWIEHRKNLLWTCICVRGADLILTRHTENLLFFKLSMWIFVKYSFFLFTPFFFEDHTVLWFKMCFATCKKSQCQHIKFVHLENPSDTELESRKCKCDRWKKERRQTSTANEIKYWIFDYIDDDRIESLTLSGIVDEIVRKKKHTQFVFFFFFFFYEICCF